MTNSDPTSASRRVIMDRLRSLPQDAPPLPQVDSARLTRFDDPLAKFMEMLAVVGGQSHLVDSESDIESALSEIHEFRVARQVVSLMPDAVQGNVDVTRVQDPHDLAALDWVILRGAFPVAENGAIWVPGDRLPHRVLLFIPQYLAIAVSRGEIVHHMHEAYERIENPPPRFGVFVSGPSKTADIEQSLVLGAHGCRTLQVFLLP
jgi:L-lactate dehydrogenase complex protein LldG